MKNRFLCLLFLAFSSLLSGILISKMSTIGRIGISLLHTEYRILKSWWKTALLLFAIQMLLHIVLSIWQYKKINTKTKFILPTLFFILGVLGLFYSYRDFTETSHRLLRTSFHAGFYLFWVTWFLNCISFFITSWEINKNQKRIK